LANGVTSIFQITVVNIARWGRDIGWNGLDVFNQLLADHLDACGADRDRGRRQSALRERRIDMTHRLHMRRDEPPA